MRYPWSGNYPPGFPEDSWRKVFAEETSATQDFYEACRRDPYGRREHLRECTLRCLLVFAKEARDHRLCPVTELHECCREYLRKLTIRVKHTENIISHITGNLDWEWERFLEKSDLWREYQKILLEVADLPTPGELPKDAPYPLKSPKDDLKAAKVAEIVNRIAPDREWRTRETMDEIEKALDEEGIPPSQKWGPNATWVNTERPLTIHAIKYRLDIAAKNSRR
jgi:hypothetical protein